MKFSTVSGKVMKEILNGSKKGKRINLMQIPYMKYAVAVFIVAILVLIFVLSDKTDVGSVEQLLADGSRVVLHRDAKVEILNINDEVREVSVIGKAYFDVVWDETRPFIIWMKNAQVKVLGTTFMIDSYDTKDEVYVESGSVELLKADRTVSVRLSEGEMGSISNHHEGIIKRNNHDFNYLSWKTKVLTFNNTSMKEVGEVLEDVYGVEVKFENSRFKNCRLTVTLNKKKFRNAVKIIARTLEADYEYSDKAVFFKGKGC